MPRQFAQTNIQLYNQMRAGGYSTEEIRRVADAYQFATRIFVGLYRGSGKTLLAHLIGTASVLAWLGRPAEVVAAGLLHAAYEDGDFGRADPTAAVESAVDASTKELVEAYHRLRWDYSRQMIDQLQNQVAADSLASSDREAVLIRIANELEDYLDTATLYHGSRSDGAEVVKSGPWRLSYMEEVEGPLRQLAQVLGEQRLATEIAEQFAAVRESESVIAPELRSGQPYMWFRAPNSYRITVAGRARKIRKRARRLQALGPGGALRIARRRLRKRP
jgi:hypothetical protein